MSDMKFIEIPTYIIESRINQLTEMKQEQQRLLEEYRKSQNQVAADARRIAIDYIESELYWLKIQFGHLYQYTHN